MNRCRWEDAQALVNRAVVEKGRGGDTGVLPARLRRALDTRPGSSPGQSLALEALLGLRRFATQHPHGSDCFWAWALPVTTQDTVPVSLAPSSPLLKSEHPPRSLPGLEHIGHHVSRHVFSEDQKHPPPAVCAVPFVTLAGLGFPHTAPRQADGPS